MGERANGEVVHARLGVGTSDVKRETAAGFQLGPAAEGVIALAAWNWDLNEPGVDKVSKAFNERNKVPFMAQEAGESYVAAWLVHRALETAKANDAKKIAEFLTGL